MKNILRFFLVSAGIVILTSFSVDATDALRGSNSALSILAGSVLQEKCPEGTVRVDFATKSLCVDIYENSADKNCLFDNPESTIETKSNIDDVACLPTSKEGRPVWTSVSYVQAKQLCAKRQMRLPSPAEWFEITLGTPDTQACNIKSSTKSVSGQFVDCMSSRGVYDAIGNVWEWVDIIFEEYTQNKLPDEGYVTDVDGSGVAVSTSDSSQILYNNDYFWNTDQEVSAMVRGGFYGAGTDAGLYAVNTKLTPSFQSPAIGFRCVKDI